MYLPETVDIIIRNFRIAYYDDRAVLKNQAFVRIVAFSSVPHPTIKIYFQQYFSGNGDSVVISSAEYKLMYLPEWGSNTDSLTPYLISCPNQLAMAPTSVSLVEHECDIPTNLLKVIYDEPTIIQEKL